MRKPLALTMMVIALTQSGFTCGPRIDPPETICPGGEPPAQPSVQVGQVDADNTFRPLSNDQVYAPEFGSQGGQHLSVAVRFYANGGEQEWGHRFSIVDDMQEEFGGRYIIQPTCAPGWTITKNLQVFLGFTEATTGTISVESGPTDSSGEQTTVLRTDGSIRLE